MMWKFLVIKVHLTFFQRTCILSRLFFEVGFLCAAPTVLGLCEPGLDLLPPPPAGLHNHAQLRPLFDKVSLLQALVASEVLPQLPEQNTYPSSRAPLSHQPNLWLGEFLVSPSTVFAPQSHWVTVILCSPAEQMGVQGLICCKAFSFKAGKTSSHTVGVPGLGWNQCDNAKVPNKLVLGQPRSGVPP